MNESVGAQSGRSRALLKGERDRIGGPESDDRRKRSNAKILTPWNVVRDKSPVSRVDANNITRPVRELDIANLSALFIYSFYSFHIRDYCPLFHS